MMTWPGPSKTCSPAEAKPPSEQEAGAENERTRVPLLGVNTDSNYIDVRDCAQGHLLALEKGRTGESYILGGENYTHPDIVRRLQRIAGIHRRVVMIEP